MNNINIKQLESRLINSQNLLKRENKTVKKILAKY